MKKYIIFICILFSLNLRAENRTQSKKYFIETLKNYKLGLYQEALNQLAKINSNNRKTLGQREYLSGLMYNKLQLFEKALPHFKKALYFSHSAKDLFYEYAQALLANNDLEVSRRAFIKSYKIGFQKGSSLYYMAYISQLLDQPKLARAYYRKVIALKTPQSSLLQGSSFQIAETNLELGKKLSNTKKIVAKYVLPQLQKALKINPTGTIASDIERRIQELQYKFDLDPFKMVNGRKIFSKRTTGYIEAKLSSDNNITLDDGTSSTAAATQASSNIYQIEAYVNRRYIFAKRFIITPDLRWNFISHSDSVTAAVWANNSYIVNPTIRTQTEHSVFSNPATFIFDFEYNYLAKAQTEATSRLKDNITKTYTFGERFKFFSFGESTFKYSIKSTESFIAETAHTTGTTLSIDQIAIFSGKHILIFLFQASTTDFTNNTTQSSSTKMFRLDYINGNLWKKIQFQVGFALTSLSYDEQASIDSKGDETTTSPSIKFSRNFSKHFKLTTDYTYTKVVSTVTSGTNYTKSVFSLAFKYMF